MQLRFVEIVLFNPVGLSYWVERTYNLLAFFATQTLANLLEVGMVKLGELLQLYSLIVGDTLNLLGVIKAAKVYFCPVVDTSDTILCEAENLVYTKALCGNLVVLIDRL